MLAKEVAIWKSEAYLPQFMGPILFILIVWSLSIFIARFVLNELDECQRVRLHHEQCPATLKVRTHFYHHDVHGSYKPTVRCETIQRSNRHPQLKA
jgi:hypothetical protein